MYPNIRMSYKEGTLVSYGEEKLGIIEKINGDNTYTIRYFMLPERVIKGTCMKGNATRTGYQVDCNNITYFIKSKINEKIIKGKTVKYINYGGYEIYINDSQILQAPDRVRLSGIGSVRSDSKLDAEILEVDFISILETVHKDLVIGMAGGNRRCRKSRCKNKKRRSTRRNRR
jgi:hypothetical protein